MFDKKRQMYPDYEINNYIFIKTVLFMRESMLRMYTVQPWSELLEYYSQNKTRHVKCKSKYVYQLFVPDCILIN